MFGWRLRAASATSVVSVRAQSRANATRSPNGLERRIVYDVAMRGEYTAGTLPAMSEWYTRPVLFVSEVSRSLTFYENQLGFSRSWQHDEGGRPAVAQVERQGCELILSSQWPDKVGRALIFVSLEQDVLRALRAELEARGVAVRDGHWGYPVIVVHDPDGNELYFPYSTQPES